MFLFSTPKAVEKSKIKTRLWRAGVIIPLLYLFGSSAYGLVTKMKWAPRLPYYLSYLLYPKGMFITLFVLIFATALFIYRRYITTKYGKKNFELYVRGNRYAFIKNIIASSTLVILVVIDFGLSKCIDPETGSMYKVVDALDLGDNYHCLCIIVPILLYRPHFGSRLSLYDTGYSTLYGISYSLGYVLIAISMLPYMSTLLPILEVILESLLF